VNKSVTMLKLPDVCSEDMNHYVSLSLTNIKPSVHLHALYSPRTALRTFTPCRHQLVISGQQTTTHIFEIIVLLNSTDILVLSKQNLCELSVYTKFVFSQTFRGNRGLDLKA
jgi:hypothetical protein